MGSQVVWNFLYSSCLIMKQSQKDKVRLFIINQLYELNDLRLKLDELADTYDIEPLEAMEFFENEVERINKLFNYPGQE
jgi:hypothetical protein